MPWAGILMVKGIRTGNVNQEKVTEIRKQVDLRETKTGNMTPITYITLGIFIIRHYILNVSFFINFFHYIRRAIQIVS